MGRYASSDAPLSVTIKVFCFRIPELWGNKRSRWIWSADPQPQPMGFTVTYHVAKTNPSIAWIDGVWPNDDLPTLTRVEKTHLAEVLSKIFIDAVPSIDYVKGFTKSRLVVE